jgi:3'-phosphoadenosine 5'-phosphosulfate sulfotransferase (PAPS reductase)/FAD synthetase
MKVGMLPSPQQRWCTKDMKIAPFEKFIGDDKCISYIGIRADEYREGYISNKNNAFLFYKLQIKQA